MSFRQIPIYLDKKYVKGLHIFFAGKTWITNFGNVLALHRTETFKLERKSLKPGAQFNCSVETPVQQEVNSI